MRAGDGAPLADEPNNLLQAELRDVTRYATNLRAVAEGCTASGDIIARVREIRDASALAPYVRKLEELRLIRIVRPLDASERERDRRYYLDDPFLAFWYRFYLPNARETPPAVRRTTPAERNNPFTCSSREPASPTNWSVFRRLILSSASSGHLLAWRRQGARRQQSDAAGSARRP